jgi:hypothetical protein
MGPAAVASFTTTYPKDSYSKHLLDLISVSSGPQEDNSGDAIVDVVELQ